MTNTDITVHLCGPTYKQRIQIQQFCGDAQEFGPFVPIVIVDHQRLKYIQEMQKCSLDNNLSHKILAEWLSASMYAQSKLSLNASFIDTNTNLGIECSEQNKALGQNSSMRKCII